MAAAVTTTAAEKHDPRPRSGLPRTRGRVGEGKMQRQLAQTLRQRRGRTTRLLLRVENPFYINRNRMAIVFSVPVLILPAAPRKVRGSPIHAPQPHTTRPDGSTALCLTPAHTCSRSISRSTSKTLLLP